MCVPYYKQLRTSGGQGALRTSGGRGVKGIVELSEEEMRKIHSVIRWNKPLGELAAAVTGPSEANCVAGSYTRALFTST